MFFDGKPLSFISYWGRVTYTCFVILFSGSVSLALSFSCYSWVISSSKKNVIVAWKKLVKKAWPFEGLENYVGKLVCK